MLRTQTNITFDFEGLELTLRRLGIKPEVAAEIMGMTPRNFQYIRDDHSKLKLRNLLALTNKVGLDIREFFIEADTAAPEEVTA